MSLPQDITLTPVAQTPAPPGGPSQAYQAFVHQRSELRDQKGELEGERRNLTQQLDETGNDVAKKGLESQLQQVDARITAVDKALADANAAVAKAAAIPGAVVEPPREVRQGPPEEFYAVVGVMIVVIGLPLSIAYARRIWKRGVKTITSIPQEIYDRFSRLDQAIDSVAIEVERIGENQRFLTRLQTEQRALGAGAAQRVEGLEKDAIRARE